MTELPLAGIRVVDFGQGVAGPYCSMLLADHGATVIKIEPPRGDWSRTLGGRNFGGQTSVSVSLNRNKQSLTVDLSKPEGLRLARQLVDASQVVVENFRPSVMQRMGLDFETVSTGRTDLVYCSINGFGPTGPYAALPAGDSITQPLAGLMSIIGGPSDPPMRVGNVVSDMLAGMNASQGVLLGLMQSRRTGKCQKINISLLESMLAFQTPIFTEYLMTGDLPRRNGNDHPMIAPSGAFKTRDGWLYFTVIEHMWTRFCDGMGLSQLGEDKRFVDNASRMEHRDALNSLIAPTLQNKTTSECLAMLQTVDVPSSRINSYADVLADPQVQHSGVFSDVDHPQFCKLPVVKNAVVLQGEKVPYSHPPRNGEHSREVLRNVLSYSEKAIDELVRAGIVCCADQDMRDSPIVQA